METFEGDDEHSHMCSPKTGKMRKKKKKKIFRGPSVGRKDLHKRHKEGRAFVPEGENGMKKT